MIMGTGADVENGGRTTANDGERVVGNGNAEGCPGHQTLAASTLYHSLSQSQTRGLG